MLVLSRMVGEEINIGENIIVKVVRTQGGRVGLGIKAPREVPVRRAELPPDPAPPARLAPPPRSRLG